MSNKLKPNELRNTLLASGLVKPSVNAFISQPRQNGKASMQAAISARRAECKIVPVQGEKK